MINLSFLSSSPSYINFRNVFIVTLVWELLFQISSAVLSRLVELPNFMIAKNIDNIDKNKKKIVKDGPSYVVAGIHACLVSFLGAMLLVRLFQAPTVYQMQKVTFDEVLDTEGNINKDQLSSIQQSQVGVEISNLIFFCFIFYDVLHVIASFPRLGGFDTIFHHAAFLLASTINGHYSIYHFSFTWLIVGEISSIFLNIRWFLIQTGRGSTKEMLNCNIAFASLFFLTRVIIYGLGLFHMFWIGRNIVWEVPAPKNIKVALSFVLFSGYFLNLFWMKSIYKIATGKRSIKKKQ